MHKLFSLVGVLAIALALVGTAAAQTQPAAKATNVTVSPIEQVKGKPAIMSAKLTDNSGKVLGGMTLRFYVETDAFGPRLMKVGEVLTDSSGVASVAYKPTWLGENKITVIYPGTKDFATSQSKSQFNAVGPVTLHQNAEFGIKTIRDWAPVGAFALVVIVWGTLVVVLFRTFRVMRTGRETAAVPALSPSGVQALPTDEG